MELLHENYTEPAFEQSQITESGTPADANIAQERWKFDFRQQQAMKNCMDKVLNQPHPGDGRVYCNRTFDGWGCWNDTLAGTRAFIACPLWAHDGFEEKLTAFKDCNPDGTWWVHPQTNMSWSNYTTCVNEEGIARDQTKNWILIIGYSISLVFLLISLFIFCYFRQLDCTRITIHKHLFVSFIIHNIVFIIHHVVFPPAVLQENGWPCRVIHTITRYFLVCNYFWMFCEGIYLHTVLVMAFVKTEMLMKFFYMIGWGLPIIPAIIYAIVRMLDPHGNQKCWIDTKSSKYVYILAVPIILSLLANLVFLCNIVRVLITKMRANNTREDHHTRKAVRATLILVPLLGLQYILFPFEPDEATAGATVAFAYGIASAVFTSLQGLFVALIFCFFNGEVCDLSKRTIRTRRESYALNRTRASIANSVKRPPSSPNSIRRPSEFGESMKLNNNNNHNYDHDS